MSGKGSSSQALKPGENVNTLGNINLARKATRDAFYLWGDVRIFAIIDVEDMDSYINYN